MPRNDNEPEIDAKLREAVAKHGDAARARRLLDALRELGDFANADEQNVHTAWLRYDDEGRLFFNNEYEIDDGEAVNMALVLLGFARRKRKI